MAPHRPTRTRVAVAVVLSTLAVAPGPAAVAGAADDPPPATLPVHLSAGVRWDVETGGIRNQGAMTFRLAGTARLAEEVSVLEGAVPGALLTYGADGVSGSFTYRETITQDDPPRGCPPLLAELEGGGPLTLERVGTAMTSGLNIRKLGSLVPRELLAFAPPETLEMMIDFYDFLGVARKQQVRGRRRGWNDCEFTADEKEVSPVQLTLRFRIPEDGRMTGRRSWAVEGGSTAPSFSIRVSDLPATMESRPLVPEPDPDGEVRYELEWAFGEVDPTARIERREAGHWLPVGEEPIAVRVGERIELRGVTLPEEKGTGRGRWTVPGRTIQEFVIEGESGFVDPLEGPELDAEELAFHWWDGASGLAVRWVTRSSDGKELTAEAVFDVREPETVLEAIVEEGEFAVAEVGYTDPDGGRHEGTELVYVTAAGRTIRFCHDPLPDDFLPGETQFVQVVHTTGRARKHPEALAGPCIEIAIEGLDDSYPYAPGPETRDNPGVPVSFYDLDIDVDNRFTMQLQYRPGSDGAIFVPLSEVHWSWIGRASRPSIADDWSLAGSSVASPPTGAPAEAYLEWNRISTSGEAWDACR